MLKPEQHILKGTFRQEDIIFVGDTFGGKQTFLRRATVSETYLAVIVKSCR